MTDNVAKSTLIKVLLADFVMSAAKKTASVGGNALYVTTKIALRKLQRVEIKVLLQKYFCVIPVWE